MKLWKTAGQIFCLSHLLRANQISPVLFEQDGNRTKLPVGERLPQCVKLNSCQIQSEVEKKPSVPFIPLHLMRRSCPVLINLLTRQHPPTAVCKLPAASCF